MNTHSSIFQYGIKGKGKTESTKIHSGHQAGPRAEARSVLRKGKRTQSFNSVFIGRYDVAL